MNRNFIACLLLAGTFMFLAGGNAIQAAPEERIPQSVMINGIQYQGMTVLQNGIIQVPNCAAPQPYTSLDQSSSGWACYDQSAGVWLLHAVAPQPPAGF